MVSPWISVIIVAYDAGVRLQGCIDALTRQTVDEFEVIVVDNASTDGAVADLRLPDERFRIVSVGRNLGFAGGSNVGFRASEAPWLATLNPDAEPTPQWLSALWRATVCYPDAAMFGSTQISARDPRVFDGIGDAYGALGVAYRGDSTRPVSERRPEGEVFGPCAAAALYRAEAVRNVGGFDEDFFCYYEDVDLAFRLRLMGQRCIQVGDAVVHHVGSSMHEENASFILYHSYRNQLWTFVKNMPTPLLWLLFPGYVCWTVLALARLSRHGKGGAAARGVWDGLCGLGPILQKRREGESARRVSWWAVARMLTWSPAKIFGGRADIRPARSAVER